MRSSSRIVLAVVLTASIVAAPSAAADEGIESASADTDTSTDNETSPSTATATADTDPPGQACRPTCLAA